MCEKKSKNTNWYYVYRVKNNLTMLKFENKYQDKKVLYNTILKHKDDSRYKPEILISNDNQMLDIGNDFKLRHLLLGEKSIEEFGYLQNEWYMD